MWDLGATGLGPRRRVSSAAPSAPGGVVGWATGMDVRHPEFGHGWVQGAGHGVLSVRFETRATGPGRMRSFRADDPDLRPGDPLDSLAWDPADYAEPDD